MTDDPVKSESMLRLILKLVVLLLDVPFFIEYTN